MKIIITENQFNILNNKIQLVESGQVFDVEESKPQIINFIQTIKNDETPYFAQNMIYSIIRKTNTKNINAANKLGFTDEQKEKWKNSLKTTPFTSDGIWSQIDYNPSFKYDLRKKTGKHIDYNFYVTIFKTKDNIIKFGQALNDLNNRLHNFSKKNNTAVSFKTHTLLDVMASDNDSLKVYYYELKYKDEIENIVKDWIRSNNILVGDRTHYHGVDRKKDNQDKESWGMIISKIIIDEFTKVIKNNGNKFSDEEYYQWFKKWLPNVIKSIKIDYGQ